MNKDVIYIDVEDDVTAIIGKIKASKESIVALVPPKRVGVLQSAVNLRLLARMAKADKKHLVLITNNQALIALSAASAIPVAKNLQSKPEIAEIPALEVDDGEDIIDGSQLPVGELARTADTSESVEDALGTIAIEGSNDISKSAAIKSNILKSKKTVTKNSMASKSGIKVPDFSKFRKKLFIGGAALVLLIAFFVWATWFAPAAKVIITAKTAPAPVSLAVNLAGSGATDLEKNTIQAVTKQIKKDVSVEFEATGEENVGEKASGTMSLSNIYSTEGSITVPAGSKFSSGDFTFVTTSSVTVPRAQYVGGLIPGKADVGVIAESPGDSYNLSPRSYNSDSVDGISADGGQMAGGTTKIATVATIEDVQKAKQALVDISSDSVKQELMKQFTNGEVIINESFAVNHAEAVVTPAQGEEVTSKAKVTSATTYVMTAIAKSEIQVYLKDAIEKQIKGSDDQRIYNDGIDRVKLSGYIKSSDGERINIATTGHIGPNIDKDAIKEQVKGLRYGDVQALIGAIEGVSEVDTQFSYFWVTTVPNDTGKIDVEFKLQDA
ncbi:MAG TPA: hypothetical protein VFS65_01220 [Candidatus Saccharimonadales bacterium]|nr:hypothetical protein [Candidatus Saccharimonadales bacterium]